MNLDKYTQKSQEAILAAQGLAQDYNHQSIEPIHILLALLIQDQGVVPAIVTKVAGSPLALRQELQNELGSRPKIRGANMDVGLSRPAADALQAAERYAKGMQDDYVSTEHILLGLTDSPEAFHNLALPKIPSYPRLKLCVARSVSHLKIPKALTSRSKSTGAT